MTEELIVRFLTEWGPWGIIGAIMWRCIQRQNAREDRLSEVVQNNAVILEAVSAKASSAVRIAESNAVSIETIRANLTRSDGD